MKGGDVVGVHVVDGLATTVGQQAGTVGAQRVDHRGVEVAGRTDGQPPRTTDVPRMHDADPHPILLADQEPLDSQLVDAVVPVRVFGGVLGGRDEGARPVRPHAAGMHHMLTIQRLDELSRLRWGEAGQVHHRVRPQPADDAAEHTGLLGGRSVTGHHLHVPPPGVRTVRLSCSATEDDHAMTRADQLGHQIGADMAGTTDHHDTHTANLLARPTPDWPSA